MSKPLKWRLVRRVGRRYHRRLGCPECGISGFDDHDSDRHDQRLVGHQRHRREQPLVARLQRTSTRPTPAIP